MRKVGDTFCWPSLLIETPGLLTIMHKMHKRTILHLWVESDGTCQSECTT